MHHGGFCDDLKKERKQSRPQPQSKPLGTWHVLSRWNFIIRHLTGKKRPREVIQFAQSHTAQEEQSWLCTHKQSVTLQMNP